MHKKFLKKIEPPLAKLNEILDGNLYYTGMLICMLTDALENFTKDSDRELREVEFKFNNFFSFSYNFESGDISINDNK